MQPECKVDISSIGNGEYSCKVAYKVAKDEEDPLWVTAIARVFKREASAKAWARGYMEGRMSNAT